MQDNFFGDKEKPVFLSLLPPQLIKNPLILNIKPVIATILEFMIKNYDRETKIPFDKIIQGAKFLEGNQNLDTIKLKNLLDELRNHLQTLGIVNGIVILTNCVVLNANIQLKDNEKNNDDLVDFIYRDLIQDKLCN